MTTIKSRRAFSKRLPNVLGCLKVEMTIVQRRRAKRSESVCGDNVAANALIDTGAILALLDRKDRWHHICVEAFAQLRLPLVTSEAVLAELFHLVGDSRQEMEAAWRFVRSGAVVVAAIENSELPQVQALMLRYWDRPMDFTNGTLVYLAKREAVSTIFTVDHADFETYRIEGRRRFRVVPANRP